MNEDNGIDEWVRRQVAAAPPLRDDQIARLREIFRPVIVEEVA
ncbi:hypothetical protein [Mycobacterium sp. OTB74]|nr:hypothetical protein [Mycobacterium sp. OTB74]MDH6242523.1 hypothetical protein [Mycobacterium sp. OTB74]